MNTASGARERYDEVASEGSTSSVSVISMESSTSRTVLTQDINVASRPYHTHLNRTIMARLPLALPPNTTDPDTYAIGIRHFLPVYHAFETAWARNISTDAVTPKTEEVTLQQAVVTSALTHLHIPQLARADRLRSDLIDLLGLGLGELEAWAIDVVGEESLSNSMLYDEKERLRLEEEPLDHEIIDDDDAAQLGASSILRPPEPQHPELRTFVRHIHYATNTKPHVLIAYAFVLYMALFNGGRWIRAQLSTARDSWRLLPKTTTEDTSEATENIEAGLNFWHFDGAHDGEDLKDEFKRRLAEVDQMLSDEQRQDIVEEAVYIFQACARLISELDDLIDGPSEPDALPQESESDGTGDAAMVRSELLQPRWAAPWGYIELMLRYLLPLGLFDLLALVIASGQRAFRHFWPMPRWNMDEAATIAKTK